MTSTMSFKNNPPDLSDAAAAADVRGGSWRETHIHTWGSWRFERQHAADRIARVPHTYRPHAIMACPPCIASPHASHPPPHASPLMRTTPPTGSECDIPLLVSGLIRTQHCGVCARTFCGGCTRNTLRLGTPYCGAGAAAEGGGGGSAEGVSGGGAAGGGGGDSVPVCNYCELRSRALP